ncbi:MAG: VWA domain-containing protein [Fimbriimonadaceae bacterium]|nr:VWA domain-containing protein [Fimbriimonadaceae bacterium]
MAPVSPSSDRTARAARLLLGLAAWLVLGAAALAQSNAAGRPHNRIVVIVDRSGSFVARLGAARDAAWDYVRRVATTSPYDEVYVLACDAKPRAIAYIQGVRSKREAQAEFAQAFRAAAGSIGTDVVGSLELAAFYLSNPPRADADHLLLFSDMQVDDAKTPDGRLIERFRPLSAFDWSTLQGATVRAVWVAEAVRPKLRALPAFMALDQVVTGIESGATGRRLDPPKRVRRPSEGGGTDPFLLGGGALALVLLVATLFVLRPRSGRPGGKA